MDRSIIYIQSYKSKMAIMFACLDHQMDNIKLMQHYFAIHPESFINFHCLYAFWQFFTSYFVLANIPKKQLALKGTEVQIMVTLVGKHGKSRWHRVLTYSPLPLTPNVSVLFETDVAFQQIFWTYWLIPGAFVFSLQGERHPSTDERLVFSDKKKE